MAKNLHLFHVIDSLFPGGGQALLFELHDAIKKYYPDISQTIISIDRKKIDDGYVKSYGIEYCVLDKVLFTKTMLDYKKPAIVVFHKLLCTSTEIYRKTARRMPVVVVNHTQSDSMSYNAIIPCDCVIAVSGFMKKALRHCNPKQKVRTIHNGVNFFNYTDIEPFERPEDDKKCLVTGRINSLNKIKYSDSWLEFCSSLNLPIPLVHEYIGGGMFKKQAKNLVKKLNKENTQNEIRLLGSIHNFQEKTSRLKSWDLFLYEINTREGVSISILEALACGIPVICNDAPGNNEIIENGVNGYCFESRGELREILLELALNRDMLNDLKRTTQEHFIKNLDARIMAEKYVDLFIKVLEGRKGEKIRIEKPAKSKQTQKAQLKQLEKSRIKKEKKKKELKPKSPKIKTKTKDISRKSKETMKDKKDWKFTILTSGWNSSKYLGQWSASILAQKHRPLEVVYVDDGSNDNTLHKLSDINRKFKEAGIELKVLRNEERQFCGTSYNKGLKEATGDFLGVLDSDDMLEKDAVEYIIKQYLKHPEVTWIYTQFAVCDHEMKYRHKGFSRLPRAGWNMLDMGKRRKHTYSHWRTFSYRFPRPDKLFKKGLRCSVDKYMGYRLEEFGKGAFIDKMCYKYRQGGNKKNISSTEPTKVVWGKIVEEAIGRRKRYKLKAHSIIELTP